MRQRIAPRTPNHTPLRRGYRYLALITALAVIGLGGCGGGSEVVEENPADYDARKEVDTGYDASEILGRLTDKETYADPDRLAALVADLNALVASRDFYTAKRQVKELSVDFKNRPMRASMAAAVMDRWNQDPPAEITVADLEQAWAIRREEKKTPEQLAREREEHYRDRLARQSQVLEQRVETKRSEAEQEVNAVATWLEAYRTSSAAAHGHVDRVVRAVTDPAYKDDLGAACNDLFQATQSLDGRIFRAPDPAISSPLVKAWERFRTASRSCMKGELAYLSTQLREGQMALQQVNQALGEYGLSL